jgi:SAM-dependent methyltransferase
LNGEHPSPVKAIQPWPDKLGYTLRRYHVDAFHARHVAGWPKGARVLDLGGNKLRKRGQFNVERYGFLVTYGNFVVEKRPDVRLDATCLPFADGAFDAVICAELLEHVYDPRLVLREAARVLAPGGRLLATVPFMIHIHGDPDDHGRYTDSFWRRALGEAGLSVVVLEKQGYFWSVVLDALLARVTEWRRERPGRRPLVALAERALAWGRRRAIAHEGSGSPAPQGSIRAQFTTGFGFVARKAGPPPGTARETSAQG